MRVCGIFNSGNNDVKRHFSGFLIIYDLLYNTSDQISFFFVTYVWILQDIRNRTDLFQVFLYAAKNTLREPRPKGTGLGRPDG